VEQPRAIQNRMNEASPKTARASDFSCTGSMPST
jgi:hypothetical protein